LLNSPKISVIVPNYNGAKYLGQCLRSLVSQTYANKEIIVVDGFSDDGSLEIIKSYPDVKIILTTPKGEADAINVGMRNATGDILTYLDSDDLCYPYALTLVGEYFANHNEAKWVYGLGDVVDAEGNKTRTLMMKCKTFLMKHYNYNMLCVVDYLLQPAIYWRRELVTWMGDFSTDEKYAFEYEWWLSIGKRYKPGFINSNLGIWRMHGGSVTSKGLTQNAKDALRIQREYSRNSVINILQYFSYIITRMIYSKEKR
jgi:glycosyltransferase involved in cell wall biosynthesis